MTATPDNPTPPVPPTPTPGQTPSPAVPPGGPAEIEQNADARTMAMLCFILGIFTWWIGPLVIWLIKKDQSPFVNDQGKEALNWGITVSIAGVATGIIAAIPFVQCIVFLIWPALGIVNLVFNILGAMKANQGIRYRYPFALRLIK